MTTQHKECEFCLGENWYGEQFDGHLEFLKYEYRGDISEGMACRRCTNYVMFHDGEATILERNKDEQPATH